MFQNQENVNNSHRKGKWENGKMGNGKMENGKCFLRGDKGIEPVRVVIAGVANKNV